MVQALINIEKLKYNFKDDSVCDFRLQSTVDIFLYPAYRGTIVRDGAEEQIREQYFAPPPSNRFVDSVRDGFYIAVEQIVDPSFNLRLVANTPLSGGCSRA